MSPKPYERLPSWGRLLCLLGCCELFALSREGFGAGYFFILWVCFTLRATLLIPVVTFQAYGSFQVAISFIFFLQFFQRLTPVWRAAIGTIDPYDPGHPGRVLFFLGRRSFFSRFFVEPLFALIIVVLIVVNSSAMNDGTLPYYLFWMQSLFHFELSTFFSAPVVQTTLLTARGILAHFNQDSIAEFVLLSFPVAVVLNNIAEFRAERAKPPTPSVTQSNEPQLTFPEVREQRQSAGSGMPSFRDLGEKLRREKH